MIARVKGFDRVLAQIAQRHGIFLAIERQGDNWVLIRPGRYASYFPSRQELRDHLKAMAEWSKMSEQQDKIAALRKRARELRAYAMQNRMDWQRHDIEFYKALAESQETEAAELEAEAARLEEAI